MENIKEKAEAFDKATSTVEKRPLAAMIVIMVIYTVACYYLIKSQFEGEIQRLTAQVKEKDAKYDYLTTELLIKNQIIDRKDERIKEQKDLIQYADSTVTQVKEQLNIKK